MPYQHIKVPTGGDKITVNADFSLNVSDQPIIPFIEGDGTGLDITPVMIKVVDAAKLHGLGCAGQAAHEQSSRPASEPHVTQGVFQIFTRGSFLEQYSRM